MSFRIKVFAAIAFAAAGCSSDGSNERAISALREFATAPFARAAPVRPPANKPYIVISYQGGRSPMTLVLQQGTISQYEGAGGVQMTLNGGLLARLRGLGQEYEALYLSQETPYLRRAARSHEPRRRVMEYWVDQQPQRDRFWCEFSTGKAAAGLRSLEERCKSVYGPLAFENVYWFDAQGALVKSRQWFHPHAASLEIEHIVAGR